MIIPRRAGERCGESPGRFVRRSDEFSLALVLEPLLRTAEDEDDDEDEDDGDDEDDVLTTFIDARDCSATGYTK